MAELLAFVPGILARGRVTQLVCGTVCVAGIANLQYGWTVFVKPIDEKHHWGVAAIQIAFWIFACCETFTPLLLGRVIDRVGPRITIMSGILAGLAWVADSYATTEFVLYLAAALAGVATGIVFGAVYPNTQRWFWDRRGFAGGITAAGFSAIFAWPLKGLIDSFGYESVFFWGGLAQGLAIFVAALFLSSPQTQRLPQVATSETSDSSFANTVRSGVFWLLYAMFVLTAASGLMLAAQLAPIAADMNMLGILELCLVASAVGNLISRIIFGAVLDYIGAELTMSITFAILALGWIFFRYVNSAPLFVVAVVWIFGFWGHIFVVFPVMCSRWFGNKYAAQNWGALYTAKGVGAFLVPISGAIAARHGWSGVFLLAAAFSAVAAALALLLLLRCGAGTRTVISQPAKSGI